MSPPLLVSRDRSLVDEVTRLAAAAGVMPQVQPPGVRVLEAWFAASVVLVGSDAAEELARLGPPRRAHVHVISDSEHDSSYRIALELGAESLLSLPVESARLTDWLIDAGDGGLSPGRLVGVVGGSGGAGATTFACALGQVAARAGTALVVDTDPLGPGIDRVLGLDASPGVRWSDLEATNGRLGARSLREALPRDEGLAVLTWHPGRPAGLSPGVVRECLSAASRGHDLVVVDLPRVVDALVAEVASRCDLVVVVVSPTVCGAASATSLVTRFEHHGRCGLVVRGAGIDPDELSGVTGVPLLAEMRDQRRLAESVDLGLGPVRSRRGPLARAAAQVLARVAV
jgi:secretion/DNA translocation related CpaE-like protein